MHSLALYAIFDTYKMFHYKPVHNLHLIVTKNLFTGLFDRIKYKFGGVQDAIRRSSTSTLSSVNAFPREVDHNYR